MTVRPEGRLDPRFVLVEADGTWHRLPDDVYDMGSPVICTHCGQVYDVQAVTVVARHADCSVWRSPCCDRLVDDRRYKGLVDIRYLRRTGEAT